MVMPGGGGNSLGTAQGRIAIDVSNVQQAAQMVKQAAAEMTAAFNTMNQSARTAAAGVGQIATAVRQMNQATSKAAGSAAGATRSAQQSMKQSQQTLGVSVSQMLRDVNKYDREMQVIERRRGVSARNQQQLERGGAVRIDTSGVRQAEAQVTSSMNTMRRSTESVGQSLQRLGGQFFVFSVAAGVLTGAGLRTANTMQAMQIRFAALEGSSEAAEARIAGLTEEARRFNLPLTEVLAGIARLQPLLKQTGNETNRFVGLVARLATINPVQGAEGAAIAIGEALSGTGNDFYSLQERFNIPRNLIRQAIAETDNFADALDSVLNQLGATNETAVEFGNTFQGAFRAARDELYRLIAEGLEPIMKVVTPIIRAFADIAARINESSPFLATMLSTTLLITAAMAPLLYAVGKFAELWKTAAGNARATAIAQRGVRAAGAALSAFAGAELGQVVYSGVTGESRESVNDRLTEFFAQSASLLFATFESVATLLLSPFETLANVAELAASGLRSLVAELTRSVLSIQLNLETDPARRAELETAINDQSGVALREFLAQGRGSASQDVAGRFVLGRNIDPNRAMALAPQALLGNFEVLREPLDLTVDQVRQMSAEFESLRLNLVDPVEALGRVLDGLNFPRTFDQLAPAAQPNFNERAMFFYNNITGGKGLFSPRTAASDDVGEPVSSSGFNTQQIDAFRRFKDEMAQLEQDYNESVLSETQQYYTRRNDIILEYNERVVQAQEDEFRRRQEAEEDLAREIADVQESSAKDQVKAKRDLEAEIAKVLRESRIRVLEAASRLDARAVFEEQRRTRARVDEMRNEFSEDEQERKRQTAERIADMQEEFQREESKRAEDFQRRLSEMERQKNRELQQLQQQHYTRLAEMQTQYTREREQRNRAFTDELNELAVHTGRTLLTHRAGQNQIENELMIWYNNMRNRMTGSAPMPRDTVPLPYRPVPTPYQAGTDFVPATDIYKLHAGEGVMTPAVNQLARSMLGGNYSQSQLAGLIGGRSRGGSAFDFSGMQIVLGDIGNRSNADVSAMIEDGLYQFFSRAMVQSRAAA